MVLNATFNSISVISWGSVLFVDETGIPGENHRQTLSHVVSSTPRHEWDSLNNNMALIRPLGLLKQETQRAILW